MLILIISGTYDNGLISILGGKIACNGDWEFPGGPVVKTSPSNIRHVDLIPDQGTKIPHALWSKNQNIKQKQ